MVHCPPPHLVGGERRQVVGREGALGSGVFVPRRPSLAQGGTLLQQREEQQRVRLDYCVLEDWNQLCTKPIRCSSMDDDGSHLSQCIVEGWRDGRHARSVPPGLPVHSIEHPSLGSEELQQEGAETGGVWPGPQGERRYRHLPMDAWSHSYSYL